MSLLLYWLSEEREAAITIEDEEAAGVQKNLDRRVGRPLIPVLRGGDIV